MNKKKTGKKRKKTKKASKKPVKKNLMHKFLIIITLLALIAVAIVFFREPLPLIGDEIIVVNNTAAEKLILIDTELISCQLECTMNDGQYHPECVGFNGCVESEYFKDPYFCKDDSDCMVNHYCCSYECKGQACGAAPFCEVKNKKFIQAHRFSCQSLGCEQVFVCKPPKLIFCNNHRCDYKD